eukprot:Gb_35250 [translate_table: standard]
MRISASSLVFNMVLEATMICIDNSEWMRNGDYSPTRLQAQADAVNLICGAKTQSNPENTVGVITTTGKGVRILVTPTSDFGKILASMHGLEVGGESNLTSSVQIDQLALKHRPNVLTDVLINPSIFIGDGEARSGFVVAAATAAIGGARGFDFGVDPNLDPKLALALRVSMEEERARQEAAAKRATEDESAKSANEEQEQGA